jgi:TDG/mug DNA glycosylase family protein
VSLADIVAPGLRVIVAGTIAAWDRAERLHYYDGAGNKFWVLLHESGLVPEPLRAEQDERVLEFGVGLTDLVRTEPSPPGEPPRFDVPRFQRLIRRHRPRVLAFVSKTAAGSYARAAGERAPRGYGPSPWDVVGVPAFVLPGPSGANNGMPLPLRIALWSDLADFADSVAGR